MVKHSDKFLLYQKEKKSFPDTDPAQSFNYNVNVAVLLKVVFLTWVSFAYAFYL